jgi:hypothetical protein
MSEPPQVKSHFMVVPNGKSKPDLPKKKFTPENTRQISNLVERGKSRNEIAEIIGVTPGTLAVHSMLTVMWQIILLINPSRRLATSVRRSRPVSGTGTPETGRAGPRADGTPASCMKS